MRYILLLDREYLNLRNKKSIIRCDLTPKKAEFLPCDGQCWYCNKVENWDILGHT